LVFFGRNLSGSILFGSSVCQPSGSPEELQASLPLNLTDGLTTFLAVRLCGGLGVAGAVGSGSGADGVGLSASD
jgi:energy-converting hydrogenase Eha subunit B